MVEVADYLVENYVPETASLPPPPQVWAKQNYKLPSTTNACESFHDRYNSAFYHNDRNIFIFVEVLRDFQSIVLIVDRQIQKLSNRELSAFDFVKVLG